MLDERLDRAERLGEREQPRLGDDVERGVLAARGDEAHHAAEVAHLPARDVVAGMIGQARVQHRADRVVARRSIVDDRARVLAVPVHADTASVFTPRSTR